MYRLRYAYILGFSIAATGVTLQATDEQPVHYAQWLIVGAGPAGIATVGMLTEIGVDPQDIYWIDPKFNVGRMGEYYTHVPGNTKAKLFIDFVNACKIFRECSCHALDKLKACDPEREYELSTVIEPLTYITTYLRTKVHSFEEQLESLYFDNDWHVHTQKTKIIARHVVLATGSHPRTLDYTSKPQIPLDIALDCYQLKQLVTPEDTILVVGSAHSAILLLKYLCDLTNVKKIINLYTHPLMYAIDMGTWLLHNSQGLKGITAVWAKEVLEKNPPAHLVRLENTPVNRAQALAECSKIIYAIGYERNPLPAVPNNPDLAYDEKSGTIAPRLFGIGIAFPEKYTDPLGNKEYRVGLTSFMEYAQRVIPSWVAAGQEKRRYRAQLAHNRAVLARYQELFAITLL